MDAPTPGSGNAAVIGALLRQLDRLGVRECSVCAGARNAPLIEALAARGPAMELRHFVDERSAAFFALGRIMDSRRPVAVLTTSGTAAAELLPAMIEAHYQNLPLVAVTADRPARYRESGAPQAIEQDGLFGPYAGDGFDAGNRGPLHFNVRLEEEFAPCPAPEAEAGSEALRVPDDESLAMWRSFLASDEPLAVLAAGLDPTDVPAAARLLLRLQAPVVAEATANLHGVAALQPLLVRGGEAALRRLEAGRVLRLGAVPVWRWWRDLDARPEVRVLNISRAPFRGLARHRRVASLPWEILQAASAEAGPTNAAAAPETPRLDELLEAFPRSEPAWMRHVSRAVGPGASVFLGNSLPIREWNLTASPPRGETAFFANRGANGIDGLISTWLGLSAGAAESWCVLGDLSALHDSNAPWILGQLPEARRRLVIVHNGGGRIFSHVAWLRGLSGTARHIMENPHQLTFEPWARFWGLDHRLLTDPAALADGGPACAVWEIRPDARETDAFWSEWRAA